MDDRNTERQDSITCALLRTEAERFRLNCFGPFRGWALKTSADLNSGTSGTPSGRPSVYNAAASQLCWRSYVGSYPREVRRFIPEASFRKPGDIDAGWEAAGHAGLGGL